MIVNSAVDTLLFADDQALLSNLESGLQMAEHSLFESVRILGTNLYTKTKMMAFHRASI